jgi:hypothetical protein
MFGYRDSFGHLQVRRIGQLLAEEDVVEGPAAVAVEEQKAVVQYLFETLELLPSAA